MIDSCFDLVVLFQREVLQWFGSYCPICVGAAESPCVSNTSGVHSWASSLLPVPTAPWVSPRKTLHLRPSILKRNPVVFPLSVSGNCLGPAKVLSINPEPLAAQPQTSFQDPLNKYKEDAVGEILQRHLKVQRENNDQAS